MILCISHFLQTNRRNDGLLYKQIRWKIKTVTYYRVYLNRDDRPSLQKIAKETPNKIFNCYIELAPNQFLELFPASENQKEAVPFNEHKGYSHFALTCDDIYHTSESTPYRFHHA